MNFKKLLVSICCLTAVCQSLFAKQYVSISYTDNPNKLGTLHIEKTDSSTPYMRIILRTYDANGDYHLRVRSIFKYSPQFSNLYFVINDLNNMKSIKNKDIQINETKVKTKAKTGPYVSLSVESCYDSSFNDCVYRFNSDIGINFKDNKIISIDPNFFKVNA